MLIIILGCNIGGNEDQFNVDDTAVSSVVESLDTASTDTGDPIDTGDSGEGGNLDPFPDSETITNLTNTGFDLEEVLEYGALKGACESYAQDPDDENLKLLCGKSMFFYEGFGGVGIPQPLFDFVNTKFVDELGVAFQNYGMILDPYSEELRPIGYGPGAPVGSVDTLAYSCASCHFGKLPDGRYSVGMGNYDYETGKQFLALMLLPQSVMPGFNDSEHDSNALEIIQPLRQKLWDNPVLFAEMGWNLLPLLWESDLSAAEVTADVENAYASWRPGTMDVFIPPLPINDEVHVVSKIPTLWSIPTEDEQTEFNMPSAMLSWAGSSPHLEHFVSGFLALSDSNTWSIEDVEPLIAYMETLSAPKTLDHLNSSRIDRGRDTFNKECLDCHDGFQGSSTNLFTFEEIGTDDQMMYIMDPDLDGEVCCGLDAVTSHQIKAPRLTGVWSKSKLLHNGSVDSLESLFCLEEERVDDTPIFGNMGHDYGCDLSTDERIDIIEFLKSI